MMDGAAQGTEAWHQDRLGMVTASRLSDVMAKGQGKTRASYMAQLAAEILSGVPTETFRSAAMEAGTEMEPRARAAYTLETGLSVVEVGFVRHPTIAGAGASPDGLVGDDGLWEGKCPLTHTHLSYLLAGKAPPAYRWQMQWQLACTGRKWVDFTSFNPAFGHGLEMFKVRVFRDDEAIAEAEAGVIAFRQELDDMVGKLTAIREAG